MQQFSTEAVKQSSLKILKSRLGGAQSNLINVSPALLTGMRWVEGSQGPSKHLNFFYAQWNQQHVRQIASVNYKPLKNKFFFFFFQKVFFRCAHCKHGHKYEVCEYFCSFSAEFCTTEQKALTSCKKEKNYICWDRWCHFEITIKSCGIWCSFGCTLLDFCFSFNNFFFLLLSTVLVNCIFAIGSIHF